MKKNLVYFVSLGDFSNRTMTLFSAFSLSKYTDFSGDVIVLSDATGLPSDAAKLIPNVRVINIFEKFPELEKRVNNRYGIFCMKAILNQLIDISDYDWILYSDSDVLFKRQKFDALMEFWKKDGRIQIVENGWKVGRNNPTTGSQVLSEEEMEKWADFGLCAGVVGFPGNTLGERLLNTWWKYNVDGDFVKDDQGNLTALILREFEGQHEFCPYVNSDFGKLNNIVHYHANNKPRFWECVKFLLREYEIPLPDLNGTWRMTKPSERLKNTWTIKNETVFVEPAYIVGQLQATSLGIYVWWNTLGGFEKLEFLEGAIVGDSFRGGEECFLLTKNH